MAPRVDPVRSDATLPARADVVIIGGGIIGASTALFLAEKGVPTVLCEKGHIAGEQSSRNWGWCRKMGRDPRELPLVIESLRLWQGMNRRVEAETGFRQCGIMYLAENRAELGQLEAWLDHARQYQLDTRLVTRAEAAGADAGPDRRLGGRALHAERRQGRAATGRTGDRRDGAPPGRGDRDRMRGARHRNRGRAGLGRGHRKGPRRLRLGGARRRRLVAPVLRQSRDRAAAIEGAGLGDAHRTDRRRPGNLGVGRPLRVSQADGRRLYRGDPRGAHDRSRPRQFPAALRLSAGGAAALEEIAVPGRPALGRGMADASGAGRSTRPPRSRRCAPSTPRPTNSSSTAPGPPSPRPFRCSATWPWRRAGAG